MPRFEILAETTVIGHSDLEKGDPPMGVAGGRFFPLPAYEAIRPLLLAARNTIQAHLALSVRTADGHAIPAEGGVQINDYSTELGPESIEIEVLGIGYLLYEKLFPGRHEAYVEWFRRKP